MSCHLDLTFQRRLSIRRLNSPKNQTLQFVAKAFARGIDRGDVRSVQSNAQMTQIRTLDSSPQFILRVNKEIKVWLTPREEDSKILVLGTTSEIHQTSSIFSMLQPPPREKISASPGSPLIISRIFELHSYAWCQMRIN